MPKITKVYTKQGDDGSTRLGGGQTVGKDAARIEAYGTVDELNSVLGVAASQGLDPAVSGPLRRIQNELFHLGSDLCFLEEDKRDIRVPTIEPGHVEALERMIDRMNDELGPLENFILPGGSPGAAHLHHARTVCRRAERLLVALRRREAIHDETLRYLNRLSDALFVLSRYENHKKGVPDVLWDSKA